MKVKTKLTVFTVVLIAAAIVISCFIVLSFVKQQALDEVYTAGMEDYLDFMDRLTINGVGALKSSDLAKESYIRYIFNSIYGAGEFALQSETGVISNNTGVNAQEILSRSGRGVRGGHGSEKYEYVTLNGKSYFIFGDNVTLASDAYHLALVRDITDTMAQIDSLAAECIASCAVVVLLAVICVSLVIYFAFKPLVKLQQGAAKLQDGEYDARILITGRSEFARLADSFNEMADAIERHVSAVEATAEERKLLLTALSHEMRTPVTAITGYSYALTHAKITQEQQQEAIGFIDSECKRLERLTSKLTQLISLQGEPPELTYIDVFELTKKLEGVLNPIAVQYGITLSLNDEGGMMYAEPDLVMCVLTNLFDNARKAGAKAVEIRAQSSGFSVSDDGKGIPPEEIDKITQPFYMLDKSRNSEGFGMGLALVKRIAELHNAQLKIESHKDKGTIISFLLKKD